MRWCGDWHLQKKGWNRLRIVGSALIGGQMGEGEYKVGGVKCPVSVVIVGRLRRRMQVDLDTSRKGQMPTSEMYVLYVLPYPCCFQSDALRFVSVPFSVLLLTKTVALFTHPLDKLKHHLSLKVSQSVSKWHLHNPPVLPQALYPRRSRAITMRKYTMHACIYPCIHFHR